MPDREIALFGGSFNPPHLGHLFVITQVLATEPVDELWLLPTHTHAFGKDLAPFPLRLAMCRAVCELFGEKVRASSVEGDLARQGRENRTVDTLGYLAEAHPDRRFALVLGTDLLAEVDGWKDPDRIRELARFIVVNRAGFEGAGTGPVIPDVSSTWIRSELAKGGPVDGWVPRVVLDLVREKGLYRPA